MGHDHESRVGAPRGRLAAVLTITLAILVAEIVGALYTGSLALVADAGHMVTDAAGITLALVATSLARRAPSPQRTFGHHRLEILAAAGNALLLFGVACYVVVEGVRRLFEPPEVTAGWLAVFGVIGLAGNAVSAAILYRAQRRNLNARGAFLEVIADGLASVGVVAASVVIGLTGWQRADAMVSLLIGVAIVPRTIKLFRDASHVLLEGTPPGVDMNQLRQHLLGVPGVLEVHDLHAWTITSGMPVLSAHVVVEDGTVAEGGHGRLLDELCACLSGHFDIDHCTFQIEPVGHVGHEGARHP